MTDGTNIVVKLMDLLGDKAGKLKAPSVVLFLGLLLVRLKFWNPGASEAVPLIGELMKQTVWVDATVVGLFVSFFLWLPQDIREWWSKSSESRKAKKAKSELIGKVNALPDEVWYFLMYLVLTNQTLYVGHSKLGKAVMRLETDGICSVYLREGIFGRGEARFFLPQSTIDYLRENMSQLTSATAQERANFAQAFASLMDGEMPEDVPWIARVTGESDYPDKAPGRKGS